MIRPMRSILSPRVRRLAVLGIAACAVVLVLAPAAAHAATYDPLNIISEENWRDVSSMSQADIQAFLNAPLPGEGPSVLASYSCPEFGTHGGSIKSAAQIIFEACQRYDLNPKVILATLEKEQSLITQHLHYKTATHSHGTDYHITYALGCGVFAGSTDKHPGFGDQVYESAKRFGTLPGPYAWTPGATKYVHSYPDTAVQFPNGPAEPGVHIWIKPVNAPTWALYVYTPYYPQRSFWNYYVKFFGDPLASPRYRPVFSIYNKKTGGYYYTASVGERNGIMRGWGRYAQSVGTIFTLDNSSTANTTPLYRVYNKGNRKFTYTSSQAKLNTLLAKRNRAYRLDGIVAYVSVDPASGPPVYMMYNKGNGANFLTLSAAARDHWARQHRRSYTYVGVLCYVGTYVAPPPPAPPAPAP